ncbi:hypothetical protein BCR43DRAFT_430348 [Syncephalastrum racemosum]|uniref:Uncharacterized protein n=1 Tax=Syncephalastrum racemosum TaxID=13706 RepID=A0A1X2HV89_SYNRA|nr:hypothetical protein BCR43DRAFT_430348 [Syncephalastrum racemosum]
MSPSSASMRTPNDVLLHHKISRPRISHESALPRKPSTLKLKNILMNGREREELMTACSKGDPNMNPDKVRDSKLRTPLLVACASGEAAVVKVLLRYGADANNPVGDIVGNKPLDLAVVSNSVESVLALLEAGAQVIPPSSPADDGVPVPIQQRLRKRSPLDLAKSRLAMMAQAGVKGDTFTDQVSQVGNDGTHIFQYVHNR